MYNSKPPILHCMKWRVLKKLSHNFPLQKNSNGSPWELGGKWSAWKINSLTSQVKPGAMGNFSARSSRALNAKLRRLDFIWGGMGSHEHVVSRRKWLYLLFWKFTLVAIEWWIRDGVGGNETRGGNPSQEEGCGCRLAWREDGVGIERRSS